uniref:Uncharacterized protein n=1 Tax=Ditylenchus dipsaci TaxID=166011 RepID=A0A915EUM6_9BILA
MEKVILRVPVSPKAVSLMWYLLELSSMHASSSPADVNHFEEITVGETIDEDGILMGSFVSTASMSSYSVPTCKSKCPGILLSSWPQNCWDKTGVLNIDLVEPASALAHLHRVAGRDGNKSLFLKYSSAENHQVAKDVRMAENI